MVGLLNGQYPNRLLKYSLRNLAENKSDPVKLRRIYYVDRRNSQTPLRLGEKFLSWRFFNSLLKAMKIGIYSIL